MAERVCEDPPTKPSNGGMSDWNEGDPPKKYQVSSLFCTKQWYFSLHYVIFQSSVSYWCDTARKLQPSRLQKNLAYDTNITNCQWNKKWDPPSVCLIVTHTHSEIKEHRVIIVRLTSATGRSALIPHLMRIQDTAGLGNLSNLTQISSTLNTYTVIFRYCTLFCSVLIRAHFKSPGIFVTQDTTSQQTVLLPLFLSNAWKEEAGRITTCQIVSTVRANSFCVLYSSCYLTIFLFQWNIVHWMTHCWPLQVGPVHGLVAPAPQHQRWQESLGSLLNLTVGHIQDSILPVRTKTKLRAIYIQNAPYIYPQNLHNH